MNYVSFVRGKTKDVLGLVALCWGLLGHIALACAAQAMPEDAADMIIHIQAWQLWLGILIIVILFSSLMWILLSRRWHQSTKSSLQLSEYRLREAQRITQLGSWELDLVNDELHWSDEVYRIFEIDQANFGANYQTFLNLIHPADQEAVETAFHQSQKNKTPYEVTHRLLMPDGRIKWVVERGEHSYAADGTPILAVGTVQDISQFKITRDELVESRKILNTIAENIPAMVYLKDANDLKYAFINKVGENILERAREDVVGKTDMDLFDKEEAELSMVMDRKILADKQMRVSPESLFRSPSGWLRYLYIVKTVLCDEKGKPTHILGMALDITDRKRVEKKLKYSEEQLKEAQRIANLGNWTLSFEGHEVYWSEELFHILGLVPGVDEPNREKFLSLVHPDDIVKLKESEERAFAEGVPHHIDVRIIRPDGETRWIHIDAQTTKDSEGKQLRLVGICQDITDRKKIERILANSEEYLKDAQRIAKIGNWSVSFENQERYWSEELYHVLGLTPGVDKPDREKFFSMIHPEDLVELKESEDRALTEGAPHNLDVRITRGDGESLWIHIDAQVSRDGEGKPIRLMGTCQDITERKLAEQALSFGKSRLRSVLDTAVDGIIIINGCGIIDSINPAVKTLFGYEEDELVGKNIKILMPEPYQSGHDHYLKQYQATNHAKIIGIGREVVGKRKDGTTFPMDLAVSEVWSGEQRMFTGFVRDITERKLHEKELVLAKERAEKASRAKSEFLSHMSHELRTPMNAILGFAQLLETSEPALDESQQEDVKEIMSAGDHLMELINSLLDLASIESGKLNITLEPVAVQSVMDECLEMLEPLLLKHQVTIIPLYRSTEMLMVMVDKGRLRQIFINLLSNAIKYNKPQGSVTLSCQLLNHDRVSIEVKDTGIGIDRDRLSDVFANFSRLDAENSTIEGTGIGLSITQQLVELMHGEIGVDSEPGVGTTFWLEFPGVQESVDLPRPDAGAEEMEKISVANPSVDEAIHTILYIEDNPANLRLMTQLLGRYPGLNILTACESLVGIALAESKQPDLILLDIQLPDIDGYEVLRRLRSSTLTCNIPVVGVSANAMQDDIDRARQAGFNNYCEKPIDIHKIMSVVRELLNKDSIMS